MSIPDDITITSLEDLYAIVEPFMKNYARRCASMANGGSTLLNEDDYFGEMQLTLIKIYETYHKTKSSKELLYLSYTALKNCCVWFYQKETRILRQSNNNTSDIDDIFVGDDSAHETLHFVVFIDSVMKRLSQGAKDILEAYLGMNPRMQHEVDLRIARMNFIGKNTKLIIRVPMLMNALSYTAAEIAVFKQELYDVMTEEMNS